VEELILKTQARCLIIDPNSDLKNVSDIDTDVWTKAAYNPLKRTGKLPHEPTSEDFASPWTKFVKRIYTGPGQPPSHNQELIQILWTNVEFNFIAGNIEPLFRNRLYHCHEFVKAVDILLYYTGQGDAVVEAKELCDNHRRDNPQEFRKFLTNTYTLDKFQDQKARIENEANTPAELDDPTWCVGNTRLRIPDEAKAEAEIPQAQERCVAALPYITEEVATYYFGIADQYRPSGVVSMKSRPWATTTRARLTVLDLPLIDPNVRLLAVDALVGAEWKSARDGWQRAMRKKPGELDTRVPVFIVVDEAHNMIPSQPQLAGDQDALRERFRTVAAEGRKYGLFLILVSQRPDKLDPFILSECANRAVMRLGSQSVWEMTKQVLGLEDLPPKTLASVLEFELGRALIAGPWSGNEPQLLYSAPRRTIEGGKNLWTEHWATLPEEIFSEEQRKEIVREHRENEPGNSLKEVSRRHGISQATLEKWEASYNPPKPNTSRNQ
jgi:hypothetical protein